MISANVKKIMIPEGNVIEIKSNGKVIWHSVKRNLPKGYVQLKSIKSEGDAYIDSGIVPDQNTRVVCEVLCMPKRGTTKWIFGAWRTSTQGRFSFAASIYGYYTSVYGDKKSDFDASINSDDFIKIDKNKNVTTINDTHTLTTIEQTFSSDQTLMLFAGNNAGTITPSPIEAEYFLIYDDDTLVRDLVSCINPDGVVGMYDMITRGFFDSKGSGQFIAGELMDEW